MPHVQVSRNAYPFIYHFQNSGNVISSTCRNPVALQHINFWVPNYIWCRATAWTTACLPGYTPNFRMTCTNEANVKHCFVITLNDEKVP